MQGSWETGVAEIWREVFQTDVAPAYDINFFDAGGTSVRLLRVRALVKERFGVELRGTDLFTHTTIEQLAAHIARSGER